MGTQGTSAINDITIVPILHRGEFIRNFYQSAGSQSTIAEAVVVEPCGLAYGGYAFGTLGHVHKSQLLFHR
jgi:hypothetical protein